MQTAARARALVVGTVVAGAGIVVVAAAKSIGHASTTTLALLAAGVVVTEVFQVPGDPKAIHPVERQGFSLSFAVIGAAALIVGPWPAALVAPVGVVVVDSLRGEEARRVAFNASVFAAMGLAGGYAFIALGGDPGSLRLPHDFVALVGLLVAAYGVETVLTGSIVALTTGQPVRRHLREKPLSEFPTAAGEASLALVVACLAQSTPWAIVAVVPLMAAVYQSKARLNVMRRETEHALETLANIVDERDRSTYRHSARVAEHVRDLAASLGLPPNEVQRLRWAGRLHDLGKIRVDGSVLRKNGPLDAAELEAMRLHPRLSARLLRRFRLAASEAQAVEYHHERADGRGYYGVRPDDIPLAAHFLIVADAFDAMTSDRPYRPGLPREAALERIEAGLGSQFHVVVGKAFVALQRGIDPRSVLSPAEVAEFRQLHERTRERRTWLARLRAVTPETTAIAGVVAAFALLATGRDDLAILAASVAVAGIARRMASAMLARRLAGAIDVIAQEDLGPALSFATIVDRLVETSPLIWAAYVSWSDRSLDATVEREWRTALGTPTKEAVTSWLIRELESRERVVEADGAELGARGRFVAVVLREGGSPVGSLVLGFSRRPGQHVADALVRRRERLTAILATRAPEPEPVYRPVLEAVS